jgi:hypothetical protein
MSGPLCGRSRLYWPIKVSFVTIDLLQPHDEPRQTAGSRTLSAGVTSLVLQPAAFGSGEGTP